MHNDAMFFALKLAKEGYYASNPQAILKAPVNIVMQMLAYELEMNKYLDHYRKMNQER